MKTIIAQDGRKYNRVSRWIKIKSKYVTRRHALSDYADFCDTNSEKIGILSYFRHDGKEYSIGQFMRTSCPIFLDENGKTSCISGYDCTQYYKPFLCEIDNDCEYVRLYEEIEENI